MASEMINKILSNYKQLPYYFKDGYTAINDDRVYRTVMFQLTINDNNQIIADFREISKGFGNPILRSEKQNIISLNDFNNKWYSFYNDLH